MESASVRPGVRAEDVSALRHWLLAALRQGVYDRRPDDAPDDLAHLVGTVTFPRLRAGLAWFAVQNRAEAGLSAEDVALWIETSALRGIRTSVARMAAEMGISTRQAHRRIAHIDEEIARLLTERGPEHLRLGGIRILDETALGEAELLPGVRADGLAAPDPLRALDAVTMYQRNRTADGGGARAIPATITIPAISVAGTGRTPGTGTYLASDKDKRYRDAALVKGWSATLAANPPILSSPPGDRALLAVAHGVELSDDPHVALAHLQHALRSQHREVLPVLLAQAGRLITDPAAAGVDAWLSYLQLRYYTAMESENIVGLRYARALAADAARLSPQGAGDPRVAAGLAGSAHILQMFGHYAESVSCYIQVIRHARIFPQADDDIRKTVQDAYTQIAYTQALIRGDYRLADRALSVAAVLADRYNFDLDLEFGVARRLLELSLSMAVRRDDLVLSQVQRRHEALIAERFTQFLALAPLLPARNRRLATQDMRLLYGIVTRDAGLAADARDQFQHTTDTIGGFANLTARFNTRLAWAAGVSPLFRDLAPVTGPPDPLRQPLTLPSRPTGFLVRTPARRER